MQQPRFCDHVPMGLMAPGSLSKLVAERATFLLVVEGLTKAEVQERRAAKTESFIIVIYFC